MGGTVALFSPRFVPPTQTFVYQETTHYQRYRAEVFTRYRMNAAEFPFAPVHALAADTGPRRSAQSLLYQATTLAPAFLSHFASGRFDLIHALFGRAGINALPYHARFKLPLVVTFRGADAAALSADGRRPLADWPYRTLASVLFRRASRCLTVSNDLAERLLRAGADPAKVEVWHSGVAIPALPDRAGNDDGRAVILIVGRFVVKKGIEYGLAAFADVARDRPGLTLRIVGDGPLRPHLEAVARATGVADRIVFVGMRSHEDLRAELAGADILFAPSITPAGDVEGVPTVMMEANARAVPAVAARTGGLPDVIDDGRTGILVAERDVPGFVEALRSLVDDGAARRAMGRAARDKMIREHDIVSRMAKLEAIYDRAVAEDRIARSRRIKDVPATSKRDI